MQMVESAQTKIPQKKITGEMLIGKVLGFKDPAREDQYKFACSIRENFLDTPLDQIPPYLKPMVAGLGDLEEGVLKNIVAPAFDINDDREKEFFYNIMRPDPTPDIKKLKCVSRVNTLLVQIENLMIFRETAKEMNPTSMKTIRENAEKISTHADSDTKKSLAAVVDIFSTIANQNEDGTFMDEIDDEITLSLAEIFKMMAEFYA